MKKYLILLIVFLLSIPFIAMSEDYAIIAKPDPLLINNNFYEITVGTVRSPYSEGFGVEAFKVKITNKHLKNIEILWDETNFLRDGKLEGVFYKYKSKNVIKNEAIAPGQSIEIDASPAYLLRLDYRPVFYFLRGSWQYHTDFPLGKNGISFQILVDGKKINERAELVFIESTESAGIFKFYIPAKINITKAESIPDEIIPALESNMKLYTDRSYWNEKAKPVDILIKITGIEEASNLTQSSVLTGELTIIDGDKKRILPLQATSRNKPFASDKKGRERLAGYFADEIWTAMQVPFTD